ncbi:unnamed protein product [Caenorhabditis angaria]|uniref:Uncharacterized protein n=1 Tax=Caenorhabditis angaria TaxID=860376 RepID=A0A9P1IT20_9PELO|nr:unnamed protein product [Caenorhabditis angaria]
MKFPYLFAEIISEFHEIHRKPDFSKKPKLEKSEIPAPRRHSVLIQVGVDEVPILRHSEDSQKFSKDPRRKSAPGQFSQKTSLKEKIEKRLKEHGRSRSASVSYRVLK